MASAARAAYRSPMTQPINLADPDFEPTDAQLAELSQRAFSGVRDANRAALEKLRAEIARERERVLRRLREAREQEPK
jgi:hypothetical protein